MRSGMGSPITTRVSAISAPARSVSPRQPHPVFEQTPWTGKDPDWTKRTEICRPSSGLRARDVLCGWSDEREPGRHGWAEWGTAMGQKKRNQLSRRDLLAGAGAIAVGGAGLASAAGAASAVAAPVANAPQLTAFGPVTIR